jgi:hypothetical protein
VLGQNTGDRIGDDVLVRNCQDLVNDEAAFPDEVHTIRDTSTRPTPN